MMKYPPELLKIFAERIASVASTQDAAQTLYMLRLTGFLELSSHHAAPDNGPGQRESVTPPDCDRVGIWERKKGTVHFARRFDLLAEWPFWANIGKIDPKTAKRRIILIGESVARGYLLDPQYTPAMALEEALQPQMRNTGVEVIDLARVSLGWEVEQLANQALLLDPDVVVIFAGNNWDPVFSKTDLPYLGGALLERGIPGLKQMTENSLAGSVRSLVRKIGVRYQARRIPLIWVVPEFNLGDWRDPVVNAHFFANDGNSDWMVLSEGARAALGSGDYQLASQLGQKMVALDEKTCAAGLYILAECSLTQNDMDAARRYLECARDAIIWNPLIKSPRAYSVTQKTLRAEAGMLGSEIVDLPRIFAEHLNGDLPDRRLFLDYCHLTVEGIRIAMAATASRMLEVLNRPAVSPSELMRHSPRPSHKVEAEAAFLAAVHNAHWYQPYDIVRYYCGQALQFAPEISQVMVRFVELQTCRTPMLMCRAAEEMVAFDWPSIQNYLLRFNHQSLDKDLLDAVVDSLKDTGIEAAARLNQLRFDEHSVTNVKTNVLDYYYCSSALQPQEELWVKPGVATSGQRDYYKAYSLESRFFFVGKAFHSACISITCRASNLRSGQGFAVLVINRKVRVEIELGRKWATWDITVPAQAVQDGLNEISVQWPTPAWCGKQGIESAAASMLQQLPPEFYHSFGEIHSCIVQDVRRIDIAPTPDEHVAQLVTGRV
ncbi:MAG TPA: hypothetical protein VI636_11795 [Candidatus Angelobacter sp.]